MNLMQLVNRMLGRSHGPEVTDDEIRTQVRERQARQEARILALDLQVESMHPHSGKRRKK